jgi:cardiolipin synthase A/B
MMMFQEGHNISLLSGGEQYFAALADAMANARDEVRLETYIFDFTGGGERVAQALMDCAMRGVRVYLLVDGAGTPDWPPAWRDRLSQAGVQWHIYNPLGALGLLLPSRWRRLHRKLCVVDGGTDTALGFCGGINILDDFHDPNHGSLDQPRFDFAVRVQGPLVGDMREACLQLWKSVTTLARLREQPWQVAKDRWGSTRDLMTRWRPASDAQAPNVALSAHFARAALLLRDNLRNRNRIERAYLKAIGEAKQEIIIANAYFLPGGKLRKALLKAAERGVRVRLLLQGRYEYFMQYHAARPVYAQLLSAGIEIHEYATSFLHAKVAVVDAHSGKSWATVGSSNLDPLSLLLAREANVVVLDGSFARDLRERLSDAMTHDGQAVLLADFSNRPRMQRWLDLLAHALMRLALSITGQRY